MRCRFLGIYVAHGCLRVFEFCVLNDVLAEFTINYSPDGTLFIGFTHLARNLTFFLTTAALCIRRIVVLG